MSFKNEKWDELERLKEKFLTLDKQQIVPSRNREKRNWKNLTFRPTNHSRLDDIQIPRWRI